MQGAAHHPASSLGTYVAIFVTLLVLTATTTAVAFVDLGRLNDVIMVTIAITKATLVVLFFMHVRQSPVLTKLVIMGALGWLWLLIVGIVGDHLTRGLFGF